MGHIAGAYSQSIRVGKMFGSQAIIVGVINLLWKS